MMRWSSLAAMALLIAGCARTLTEFEPLDGNTFRFEASADGIARPPDGPKAEADRMAILGTYLSENHLCPNGYTIIERKVVQTQEALIGDTYTIFYRGVCNGS